MKTLEKCESFFSSKLASFLSEPKDFKDVKDEEEEMRALARATVIESQSNQPINREKSFEDYVEKSLPNKGPGMITHSVSLAAPPSRIMVGSALVPPGGKLAGTFSAPVGYSGAQFQAPFTGALHGSLRVPTSGGGTFASPLQAFRDLDDTQKEDMRKQFAESVKKMMKGGQANGNLQQKSQSAVAPRAESPVRFVEASLQNGQKLRSHLGNQNAMVVPVLQMQQGFSGAARQNTGPTGDASQRARSPLALANIAGGRAASLSGKMPLMTNRGQPGIVRQASKQ